MKQNRSFIFIAALMFFFAFVFVVSRSFAQAIPGTDSSGEAAANQVSISFDPAIPQANDVVTATLVSYSIDLNALPVKWYVNGRMVDSGLGKKTFTFKMGVLGSALNLRVEVDTPESQYGTIVLQSAITSASVDFLWQADTYTPPFYRGKALPTSQSMIKVVASPTFFSASGKLLSGPFVYTWEKESETLGDVSGTGKNTLIFTGNYAYNTDNIRVIVKTIDGSIAADRTDNIMISVPKIVFYQNKSLEGVRYETAINSDFQIPETEVTIHAEPYFFSFPSRNKNNGNFAWILDGQTLTNNPDDPSEYTLRTPDKGSGSVNVSLEITNRDHYMQDTTNQVRLNYSR